MLGAAWRGRGARLAWWIPALLLSAGCATPSVMATRDGFVNRGHDYRIAGAPPGWKRARVEGAVLAFRRSGPSTMSLQSRCGKPVASPQLMARHLVIRLPERELIAAGPIAVDGRNAWSQTFDTQRNGVWVRVKTVTLVALDCTFDWVLASSGGFAAAEQDFDAWWQSFRLGERYREEPG